MIRRDLKVRKAMTFFFLDAMSQRSDEHIHHHPDFVGAVGLEELRPVLFMA